MKSTIFSALAALALTLTVASTAKAEYAMRAFPGYDAPGNDIDNFVSGSQLNCETSCIERGNCTAASFEPANGGRCWLKTGLPQNTQNPHSVLCELARVCRPTGRVYVSIPWVPRTFIHPRQPGTTRGSMHVMELCRDDFAAIVSHAPLRIQREDVCDLFGPPGSLAHRLFLRRVGGRHIVGGGFRKYQFFELVPAEND